MDQSLVGDGRRGVAPIGNDTKCVFVPRHMFLPPSVLLTVVYIVNASISHTFWIFHIWHGVYM